LLWFGRVFKMMKAFLTFSAIAAVSATVETAEYEWVEATPDYIEPYVNDAPSMATVVEFENTIVKTEVPYIEYETIFEYEYIGAADAVLSEDVAMEEICTDLEILDCDMNCAPAYWIANGLCDGGENFALECPRGVTCMQPIEKGDNNVIAYNFNCEQFFNDGGDCEDTGAKVQSNYISQGVNGGVIFLQSVSGNTPVLGLGVIAVVAAVGVAMKRRN